MLIGSHTTDLTELDLAERRSRSQKLFWRNYKIASKFDLPKY